MDGCNGGMATGLCWSSGGVWLYRRLQVHVFELARVQWSVFAGQQNLVSHHWLSLWYSTILLSGIQKINIDENIVGQVCVWIMCVRGACMYVCVCVWWGVYMYMCVHACVHTVITLTYSHSQIHAHTHTHTHTFTRHSDYACTHTQTHTTIAVQSDVLLHGPHMLVNSVHNALTTFSSSWQCHSNAITP